MAVLRTFPIMTIAVEQNRKLIDFELINCELLVLDPICHIIILFYTHATKFLLNAI